MNALIMKFAALTVCLGGMTGLTGCAGAFAPETDPTSAVAPRVQALVDANREYPRWEDFPRSSAPVAAIDVALQVNTLRVSGGALAGEVARLQWTETGDPAAYAARTRARVDAVPVSPVTAETLAEIEAFANRNRERGRAPPPIDRR